MTDLCEACERNYAELDEPCDDPEAPYKVCRGCDHRLHAFALRPLEWYNLSKRHGWWQFLLHDDFYDEDGVAYQADQNVDDPEAYPAPTLADVCHSAEGLLDYSITRWQIRDDVSSAWKRISAPEVLSTISKRFTA